MLQIPRSFSQDALRVFAVTALLLVLSTVVVCADPRSMTALDAFKALGRKDILVLDIRSPAEWRETGVAQGAWPVTMHSPDFRTSLTAILSHHPNTPIALICATGGRSNYVASLLLKNGISNVVDISEGMFGNGDAPGWIARGLPIVDIQTAQSGYAQSRSN